MKVFTYVVPLYLLHSVGGVHLCRLLGTTPTQSNDHTPFWHMHCIGRITSSSPLPIDPAPSSFCSAAIYLKNMIMKYWRVREAVEGAAPPYSIPDNVKEVIRGNVVEAIIQTPGVVG